VISTRRFFARPSGMSLGATGSVKEFGMEILSSKQIKTWDSSAQIRWSWCRNALPAQKA
jgi:hypothetical protein